MSKGKKEFYRLEIILDTKVLCPHLSARDIHLLLCPEGWYILCRGRRPRLQSEFKYDNSSPFFIQSYGRSSIGHGA
jgi:hypothetical protein